MHSVQYLILPRAQFGSSTFPLSKKDLKIIQLKKEKNWSQIEERENWSQFKTPNHSYWKGMWCQFLLSSRPLNVYIKPKNCGKKILSEICMEYKQ